MTSVEQLVRWLAVIGLTLGGLGVVGAGVAEIRFRLALPRLLKRLTMLRKHLDHEERNQNQVADEPSDRSALLREIQAEFTGVLARDLDRHPELAQHFDDLCRRVAPPVDGRAER